MRIETALRHRDRALARIRDLWTGARIYHMSHETILKRKAEIMATIKHCPAWVREYVRGADYILFQEHYKNLEFCYLVDGVLYSTSRNTDRRTTQEFYDAGEGHRLGNAPSGHYYIGTDKEF